MASAFSHLWRWVTGQPDTAPRPDAGAVTAILSPPVTSTRTSAWFDERLSGLTVEQLTAFENDRIATVARSSDSFEAVADERQDPTTSINFPLHWTSAFQSWQYLFDFGIACELLAPRPDDLVLDLAAGTCWATEMLARLGIRTVSVDLSVEMMKRAQQRLAADRRLVFREDAAFIVARGQALPFASETFDGVVCMNALHHMPSYAAALAEVYRVLKPGGRAVFSEPGTEHATQALSQFRMREETIVEKSVSLPSIHRLARAAGFGRMTIVPLRSARAYAVDYHATRDDVRALEGLWRDTLQRAPAEHARFALHKGDDPAPDTLLPADRLVGRLRADITAAGTHPIAVALGRSISERVTITNAGSVTWRSRGRRFGGQVTLGVQICDRAGTVLRDDLGRTPLPGDLAPGASVSLHVTIPGELPAGDYVLRYDMVVEGVTWFAHQGSRPVERPLVVRAG